MLVVQEQTKKGKGTLHWNRQHKCSSKTIFPHTCWSLSLYWKTKAGNLRSSVDWDIRTKWEMKQRNCFTSHFMVLCSCPSLMDTKERADLWRYRAGASRLHRQEGIHATTRSLSPEVTPDWPQTSGGFRHRLTPSPHSEGSEGIFFFLNALTQQKLVTMATDSTRWNFCFNRRGNIQVVSVLFRGKKQPFNYFLIWNLKKKKERNHFLRSSFKVLP